MNVCLLIRKSKSLQDELTEAKIQLQKAQADLDKLVQEQRKTHREISNMLALFTELGEDGLHQNKILSICFKDETERLGVIRILIIEKIHDAESSGRQNKYLRELLEGANQ
ncbi:MAG: hypothetical protein Q8N58_01985 [bacterium]|nr:hypothetical protein [bacterium]